MNPFTREDLLEISRRTLGHYNGRAAAFWEGTRDHDVSQNIQALIDAIDTPSPHRILDLGCGPGRDLLALSQAGHQPTGLDGSAAFCEMARAHASCPVWQQDFLALDLPDEHFDGVFANASLFHVPTSEIVGVLAALHRSLRPGGVLFSSNPRGNNVEGWNHDRYGAYHDLEAWSSLTKGAGFQPIGHYYRPAGLPRDQQPWLASTWRKSRG